MKTKNLIIIVLFNLIPLFGIAQNQKVSADLLCLRSSPVVNKYNIIEKISYGEEIVIIEKKDNWTLIKHNSKKGYVDNKFLKKEIKSKPKNIVLICTGKTAYAYHKKYCRGLKKCSGEVIFMTKEQAEKKAYKPCGFCFKKRK